MDIVLIRKIAVIGLKILAFVVSGISVYLGIKELAGPSSAPPNAGTPPSGNNPNPNPPAQPIQPGSSDVIVGDSGLSEKGQKVAGTLSVASTICLGIFEVFKSLGAVTNSVDRLFRKKRYNPAGTGGYIPGNYPWNNPEQGGYPNNAPIYRGQDGKQDGIYWIQREEGITEVW